MILRALSIVWVCAIGMCAWSALGVISEDDYRDPLHRFASDGVLIVSDDRLRPLVRIRDILTIGAVGDARGNPVEFAHFDGSNFSNGLHAIKTLACMYQDAICSMIALPVDKEGKVIVTDDSIMTELTLTACMYACDVYGDPSGDCEGAAGSVNQQCANAMMAEIAKATFMNFLERGDYEMGSCFPVHGYSWASPARAPGTACFKAMAHYEKQLHQKYEFAWDRSSYVERAVGREGGCGKIMDSAAFGILFYMRPSAAAQLAALHSCISHPDIVSQAACGAYALGIALGLQGKPFEEVVGAMFEYAKQFSDKHKDQETIEWNKTPEEYKTGLGDSVQERATPYTVYDRLLDAKKAALSTIPTDEFYACNTGFGAPDYLASVLFTAYRAQADGWTISEAMNRCINTTAATDRDSLAAGVGRFMAAFQEFASGIDTAEFDLLERHVERVRLAAECASRLGLEE